MDPETKKLAQKLASCAQSAETQTCLKDLEKSLPDLSLLALQIVESEKLKGLQGEQGKKLDHSQQLG
jgi:hypothetical protein